MRPGVEYAMVHGPAASAAAGPSSSVASSSTKSLAPRSPWQSPVPYLFGGLAAMLGLIALSLLALACSYWKLAGSDSDGGGGGQDGGEESRAGGEKGSAAGGAGPAGEWRYHVVVIMAGDERPMSLATPESSRAADADVTVCCSCGASGPSTTEVKTTAAECEASTRPAGEPQVQSPSEQTSSSSHSSVITS